MFNRLQEGAKLLKSGNVNKLFKEKLAIVVRNVSESSEELVIAHFLEKIQQACQEQPLDNFHFSL